MANPVSALSRMLLKLFGSRNERVIKQLEPLVARINELEPSFQALSDEQLGGKTAEFRDRLAGGATLDDLMPEAFACVREAARRNLKTSDGTPMRHFDVQLIGGIVLHQGKIAEMATGEGKTLVATLPSYLNALSGSGVHVVTVNDYLAQRDRDWMAPVFEALDVTCGAIQSEMGNAERKAMYEADITYGTNNEFGFDYLRDHMKLSVEEQVQGKLAYAIVDEVDSILIDEARTPLIISGPGRESSENYYVANRVAKRLARGQDFEVKEKERSIILTEGGIEKAEKLVGVPSFYHGKYMEWPHLIEQALRAHHVHQRDVDYVVRDGEVIIVDEFTGRLMEGRRWSDGLHQAVEAKEGLKIRREQQTLATITLQNYFKQYEKLSGMTGTAMTEAVEFDRIYRLEVVSIPTNKPIRRDDMADVIYRTNREKYGALTEEIVDVHNQGRPILVGTTSIEKSELLSGMLRRRGVKHDVLNAKQHEREAEIIKTAGVSGRVTIATNMAGRGTDIVLGPGVKDLGGLHVVGTERHEARRIDNQLRGRCGRQGDLGSSKFFLSLEDDLMRRFAADRVSNMLKRLGMREGEEISHPWVTKSIERAQKKVEGYFFDIRRNLLEYDGVLNEQRKIVYSQRQEVLEGEDLGAIVRKMMEEVTRSRVAAYADVEVAPGEVRDEEQPDPIGDLRSWLTNVFGIRLTESELGIDRDVPLQDQVETVCDKILSEYDRLYAAKRDEIGVEMMRRIERFILLTKLDEKWRDHLQAMDHLRAAISMRAMGQIDPKIAYKREGYEIFSEMIDSLRGEVAQLALLVQVQPEDEAAMSSGLEDAEYRHEELTESGGGESAQKSGPRKPIVNKAPKLGRNDPCSCGSGKKYKRCCGAA